MPQARLRNREDLLFDLVITAAIVLICVAMVYPFLYTISVSLSHYKQVQYVTFFPRGFTTAAYRFIFAQPNIQRGYANTFLYTTLGVTISMALTTLCAYPLSKKWLPGRAGFSVLILITMYFGGGLIPIYLLVNLLGLYNTLWALIIPGALGSWNMIVMRTYFQTSIPVELEESSFIDGANEFTILSRIYLPLSKPILATLSLFYFVGIWNSWFPASIYLSDKDKYPIQLILRNAMITLGSSNLGADSATLGKLVGEEIDYQSLNNALTIAVVLPIIFIYPFCQRYFIKGIMIGSIKG